jgi:hypothetical protein
MATPTVLSIGNATVPASGGQTGDLLQQLANMVSTVPAADIVTVSASASVLPPPPTTGAGPFWLTIPEGYTGSGDIPSGYAYIVYSGSTPLSGGSASETIAGTNVTYTGGAAAVIGTGSGSVTDSSDNATLSFSNVPGTGGSSYNVTVSGTGDNVTFDSNTGGTIVATGTNDNIQTGTPSGDIQPSGSSGGPVAAAASVVPETLVALKGANGVLTVNAGSNDGVFVFSNAVITATGGSATIVDNPGASVTVNASTDTNTVPGSLAVFGNGGTDLINAGLATSYESGSTGTTIYNATTGGNDTIFAVSSGDFTYNGGKAASLFFLAETGAVTAGPAASETIIGGSGGGSYSIGSSSFTFAAGSQSVGGGADSLFGAASTAAVGFFGFTNENLTVTQADSVNSNVFTAFGNDETINATAAAGGNTFQIINEALTIPAANGAFAGNTTIFGSNAGGDHFSFLIDGSVAAGPAHTITIENWKSTDNSAIFDLSNSAQSLSATDLAAVNAFNTAEAGGANGGSFTLQDGTTINFVDAKGVTVNHV